MNISKILNSLPGLSVLVAGDICLDRWCSYDPSLSEPSRETGIPRLAVVSTETTPGAAGVVASNLAALGVGRVTVLGAVGMDGHAFELIEALRRRGIDPSHLVREPRIPTFTRLTSLSNSARARWISPQSSPRCTKSIFGDGPSSSSMPCPTNRAHRKIPAK